MSRILWRKSPGATDELRAKQAARQQQKDFTKANSCKEIYDMREACAAIFE